MKRFIMLTLILLMGIYLHTSAQGNLLITPMRVVFEGNKQKSELNLANVGTETATYSISFRQYTMTEQGQLLLIEIPDSTQMLASPYLRVFPRQVTLAPGEAQVVMLQCRRKKDMLPGEYRSHIWFRSEKNSGAQEKKQL
jgi:P pilus assembly chaperone PapD